MSHTDVARTATGTVVSTKMQKTITVRVERQVKHPLYGKYIRRSRKIHAHDDEGLAQEGDMVTIEETRPISRTKSWKLRSVDRKATVI